MKGSIKKNLNMFWKGWGCSILIAVIIATSFKSAIADWNIVPTGSMKPTILEGDRIFVNKLSYDLKVPYTRWHIAEWNHPKRGDIVVFYSPVDGKRLVKRVVGVPGDSIEMERNQLIINDKKIEYESGDFPEGNKVSSGNKQNRPDVIENLNGTRHPVIISHHQTPFNTFEPVIIPENHYFMLGDNRDNSADSRYFGFVERSLIVGRALAIVISLDSHNHYKPRWDRFFTELP